MCTAIRFADENRALFFGRNLDWMESYGEEILATPRGFSYHYALGATHADRPHAVLGVGCIMNDKPMYFDCANETGLAVTGLNFPRCGSLPHEPIEGKRNVPRSNSLYGWRATSLPLTRSNTRLPTRKSSRSFSLGSLNRCCTGSLLTARAASRFVRAAYANAHHPAKTTERENVARLFRTLASVQVTEGTVKSAHGHFEKTIFTSGFSGATNTYYANTYDDFEIRAFPFDDFDMNGSALQTRALY